MLVPEKAARSTERVFGVNVLVTFRMMITTFWPKEDYKKSKLDDLIRKHTLETAKSNKQDVQKDVETFLEWFLPLCCDNGSCKWDPPLVPKETVAKEGTSQ